MPNPHPATTAAATDARVVSNTPLCREHVALEAVVSNFPHSHPGQFLEIACSESIARRARLCEWPTDGFPSLDGREWKGDQAFLRRPFSIADRWDEADGAHLQVISRRVGPGTRWLEQLAPGARLNITGPLGRGFRFHGLSGAGDAGAASTPASLPIALVGGGVGIPPLLYMARRLHDEQFEDVNIIFGATTRDMLPVRVVAEPDVNGMPQPCVALPGGAAYPAIITTDDGSLGLHGLATDGLSAWYRERFGSRESATGAAQSSVTRVPLVLACGPARMLRAIAELTRRHNLDCQLCIERSMGCGLGTCLSCVVRLCDSSRTEGWRWGLTCQDGPVFWRDELLDYPSATPA